MGTRGGAGGVLQSGAMGPSEAVLLWLLLGVLGAAACGERCGNGLPPAPGPAAPRSWAASAGSLPAVHDSGAICPAESHSLRYFLTGITDPGPGMPQFMAVGYVDGKAFGNYDSERRTVQPIVDWLAQEDVKHWDAETKKARSGELDFYVALDWLQEHYNKSRGELQWAAGLGWGIRGAGALWGVCQPH